MDLDIQSMEQVNMVRINEKQREYLNRGMNLAPESYLTSYHYRASTGASKRLWLNRPSQPCLLPSCARSVSTFDNLHKELTSRRLPLLQDIPTPLPSYLLDVTLADFLPPPKIAIPSRLPSITSTGRNLPPAHHLILFPPPSRLSALLPDGTDPEQSPGKPFVRRMWAGGRINFRVNDHPSLKMLGKRAFCLEHISDVAIKGPIGNEKIYVTIERRVSQLFSFGKLEKLLSLQDASEDLVRESLRDKERCSIIEHRNIVFMREQTKGAAADAQRKAGKILRPQHEPTFSHTLTPTAALLFRFSALTFNAHRIHLDKQYCQETEGHRNLLVHGPLSLVLMVEVLRRHLATLGMESRDGYLVGENEKIDEIEYRNLAPLYAEEPMKVCGRAKSKGEWEVWIEGRDGGYAVRGTVKTSNITERRRDRKGYRMLELKSTAGNSATGSETTTSVSDEPDPAPRHTVEDPEEYGKIPLAS
ncbi:hypothetical protein MMC18_001146 [Xylographa bjoerkii]|nr:hypothetical protein [Xylographa bjoerkii]